MRRKVFQAEEGGCERGWRKWHNELHDFYSLSNIRVFKSGRNRWAVSAAHTGEKRCKQGLRGRKPEGKRRL
jgi:hypothetical protein